MEQNAATQAQTKHEIRQRCTRFLSGHRRKTTRGWLASLAESPLADEPPDLYGEGAAINSLESEVASLLGKEAGLFVIKGIIAQLVSLRVWTDRSGSPNVALHRMSHIDLDEQNGYERLHGLRGIRLGDNNAPFGVSDLRGVHERLGIVVVELPLRRAGFKLPAWDDLGAISEWCRERAVPVHFDGARLWESQPFYGRDYSEIAALADSVYVSFYKGLGGLGGCVLAGSSEFIAQTRVWKTRHGGNLVTAFPYVISAKEGLQMHVPQMGAYHRRAVTLAAALSAVPGVSIAPMPPHTNAFQIYLKGNQEPLERAALELAKSEGVWLFDWYGDTPIPGLVMSEISIGNAAGDLTDNEVAGFIEQLLSDSRRAVAE
jgi:threonine aldolase